ncbi:unnamed protein product [Spodoptera littoralis]|uniref:SNF2 N-terminal domain-containing protein n=1 Tax=Spodoptera littoralis TaxID=7109 RepID=A0A9P0I165_SPOLI|nr:unnamed protein product [Spodoptera littoralis]CAH1637919.1 unnamed protein product [Spodoptera littoralis]
MDSSFFEYRSETAADSGSESEFIDDSLVDESFGVKKKNHTVFVAESEESTTDEDNEKEKAPKNVSKSVVKRSSVVHSHVISSSDDDTNARGSIRRQSDSSNKVVLSSSDNDEAVSPEIVPKRRPLMRKSSASNNDSIIGRKTKKRMMLIDSDTENSIIIEHDKHKKLLCTKDTPLKIDSGNKQKSNDQSMIEDNLSKNESKIVMDSDDEEEVQNESAKVDKTKSLVYDGSDDSDEGTEEEYEESDDDGPDEDQMVMSRATRMSIMGVGSVASLTDLPELQIPPKTPEKTTEDQDSSRISCSPFSSPLQDITNESINARKSLENKDECVIVNDTEKNPPSSLRNKVLNNLVLNKAKENFIRYDDDVTIIDTKPEIIALSSDDEDEEEMSQNSKTITKYLMPPSHPGQQVVYVKKHVREAELMKLESLKEDLKNVKYLLEEMDVNTLPDGGGRLIERMTSLEEQFRRQGEKVANMVVEQDHPGADVDKKGLSWDELQKASNAVMPRMFGKQAMATHMAERNLILDRLRDLYESLASPLIASDKEDKIDDDDDDDDGGPATGKMARGGTLVVCPASLMQQWAGEVSKHCAAHALAVCLHHGANRTQQASRLAGHDLVLTTYNIMQRDNEKVTYLHCAAHAGRVSPPRRQQDAASQQARRTRPRAHYIQHHAEGQ